MVTLLTVKFLLLSHNFNFATFTNYNINIYLCFPKVFIYLWKGQGLWPIVWGSLAYVFLWTTKDVFGLFTTSSGSVCLSITLPPTRCWCVCLLHLSTDLQDQCCVSFIFIVWPSVLGPDTMCVLIRRLLSWNYSKVSKTQSSPSIAPGYLERRICKLIILLWCGNS